MKPSWETAPEWATHLAMDENGQWYWFDREPVINEQPVFGAPRWDIMSGAGHCSEACVPGWGDTLEMRPV